MPTQEMQPIDTRWNPQTNKYEYKYKADAPSPVQRKTPVVPKTQYSTPNPTPVGPAAGPEGLEDADTIMFNKRSSMQFDLSQTPGGQLQKALAGIDLDALEAQHKKIVKTGPKSKRDKSIKVLGIIEGLRRNEVLPTDLMIRNVPVIPAKFRPFSAQGTTFLPGDSNVLYKELMDMRDAYDQERSLFGLSGAGTSRGDLYRAVKAVYGYGDPVNEKSRAKGVSGFMQKVLGKGGPKYSFYIRKMIGKPQDSAGRSVIIPNPELGMDEIGIPEDLGWKMYGPYVQRKLVQSGMNPGQALEQVMERTDIATKALNRELKERPIVYSRAPVWHKYGVLSGEPRLVKGNSIEISTFTTEGLNADFDGDTLNLHVPSLDDAVEEARTILKPSYKIFRTRNPESIMPSPKHEQLWGLYNAKSRPAKNTYTFNSAEEAEKAIKGGYVSLSDEIEIKKV
jgi:DNA-directed RNA polymerase subunit beta'